MVTVQGSGSERYGKSRPDVDQEEVDLAIGLTPEQEAMLEKLQAIKNAEVASKQRCMNCGSDLHDSCRHHDQK